MTPLIIPHGALEPATLQAMLEEFVTRDGTDYGAQESLLPTRVAQVRRQLESGKAVIVYDSDTETFGIMAKDQLQGL